MSKSLNHLKLLVISHVIHYEHDDTLFAFGPYAREVEILADMFAAIEVAAPLRRESPPRFCTAIARGNVSVKPQPDGGGDGLFAKIRQALRLPLYLWKLSRAMKGAEAIHVRCPGNLGLLGTCLAPFYTKRMFAKYAGRWSAYDTEPMTFRFQRWLLSSRHWKGPVTVYGEWADQPDHIVPFFTSMMTEEQVSHAVMSAQQKSFEGELRILFSGRLEPIKGVAKLIDALTVLKDETVAFKARILGNGSQLSNLVDQARRVGLSEQIEFLGDRPYDEAIKQFEWAQILALPSVGEGFPKAISEAMCHGLVCIGSRDGFVPRMLEGRGIVLDPSSPEAIAEALMELDQNRDQAKVLGMQASDWSRQFSLPRLRDALERLLTDRWGFLE